jgi:hypothetical protein
VGEAFFFSADAGEVFDVIIPGGDILIAYGPVDCNAVFGVSLEVQVAESITLPSPGKRPASDLVAADPIEGIILYVGIFTIVDEKLFRKAVV